MRLGKIQAALMQLLTDAGGYAYLGAGTTAHQDYGLGGRSLEEIQRSLAGLIKRGLIREQKPGFYSLSDWVRPQEDKT